MKKAISVMLVIVLMFSLCLPVSATQGSTNVDITYRQIKVLVNGVEITPLRRQRQSHGAFHHELHGHHLSARPRRGKRPRP
ncbi:MAG: hypothetical protein IJV74_08010 [Clostridia bacterium]|nr:hypothetical protein [Clostridia bacterium]